MAVEILSVSPWPEQPDELRGSSIDFPKPGSRLEGSVLRIVGWVLGQHARAVAVSIAYEGDRIAMAPVRQPRPDVADVYVHAPEAPHSGFAASLDVLALEPQFELSLEAVLEGGGSAPIASIQGRYETVPVGSSPTSSSAPASTPTLRADLEELISTALAAASSGREVDPETAGSTLSDEIDFEGKKVLDIGAHLGELSRQARAKGAALVDGLEADPALVRLARLLTAQQKVARVFFHHRELTSRLTYSEHYDIVLATSVLDVIEPVLTQIAAITDGVLVTEPPSAAASASPSLKTCFPFARPLSRSFAAYAKSDAALDSALRRQPSLLEAGRL